MISVPYVQFFVDIRAARACGLSDAPSFVLNTVYFYVTINIQNSGGGLSMNIQSFPQIRPLSDLRSSIGEITEFVDNQQTPVILTKHGHGKYVFLSLEEYSELVARRELYQLLDEGLDDIANGRTQEFSAAMKEIRKGIAGGGV